MQVPATIETWTRLNAGLLLLGSLSTAITDEMLCLVGASVLSMSLYFYQNQREWQALGWLGGPPNWVSLGRWLGLLVLLVLAQDLAAWTVCLWALGVLCLDGLDGFLARRLDLSSLFGEYLDKETDAFYMLGLSHLVWQADLAGPWILALGWWRYLYVLALIRWKPSGTKETRSQWGRIIAVVLMIGVAAIFITPMNLQLPLAILLVGLVSVSFGRSFLQLRGEKTVGDKV